jgi:hypothetical protein
MEPIDVDKLTLRQKRVLREIGVLSESPSRKRGRPTVWGKAKGNISHLMHIWIAIEIARKDRSVKETVKSLFGHRDPRWFVFVGREDESEIKTSERARKLYYEAQKLLKSDPELCCEWAHNLELAKRLIKWRPKIREKSPS